MANQYDAVVIKAGIPSVVGTDIMRADSVATGGLTTSGLATGDACQVSSTLTLTKADFTSVTPVIGIYDGVSGSVVRAGIVAASFSAGPTTPGEPVYLSNTPGQLTNVKPTGFYIHEVGVTVEVSSRKILFHPKTVVALPPNGPIWRYTTQAPSGVENAGVAYHSNRKLAVLYTSWNLSGDGVSHTLTYDPKTNTWADLADATPGSRTALFGSMCYASSTGKIYLHGGVSGVAGRVMWSWDGAGTWASGTSSDFQFPATAFMAYDSTHNRIIVHQTDSGYTQEYNPSAGSWDPTHYANGTLPDTWQMCQMAYLPSIDKCVWFGNNSSYTYLYDQPTHTWSRVAAALSGSRAMWSAMYYDALRSRIQLCAGRMGGSYSKQVWSFNGTTWTRADDMTMPGVQTAIDYASGCFADDLNMGLVLGGTYYPGGIGYLYANEGTW